MISESQNVRIKLHRMYDNDVLNKLTSNINDILENSANITIDTAKMIICIKSDNIRVINSESNIRSIANIISNLIVELTQYEYPDLLFTIMRLPPDSILIEL